MKQHRSIRFLNSSFLSSFLSSILFIYTFSFLISCSTLTPLTGTPEAPPQKATVPGALIPQWASFAPGIDYYAGQIRKPLLELRALRVDLTSPNLEFVVNKPGPVEGVIPSTTITGFTREYGCIAGINTNPFSPVSAKVGEDRTIDGITIADGVLVAPPHPYFDALVFYRNGEAAIINQKSLDAEALGTILNAVGGFSTVLVDGELAERVRPSGTQDGIDRGDRHPRSAAGLSADGRVLYLLVIDGRQLRSVGATEAEIGVILKQLGAAQGLNFDGGGSTALALRYGDGKVRAVNVPIHGMIPGKERGVATCLGIRVTE
jgi:hypothetical protein